MFLYAIVFAVLIVVIVFLKTLPLKKEILIEGVLQKAKEEVNLFDGTKWRAFYFRKYCRQCVERGKRKSFLGCYDAVPVSAKQLGSYDPKPGDSVQLVVFRTLFRKIKSYELIQTEFGKDPETRQKIRGMLENWEQKLLDRGIEMVLDEVLI